jgi:hypothetical protein
MHGMLWIVVWALPCLSAYHQQYQPAKQSQQGKQEMQDVTEEVYKLKLAAQPDRLQVRPSSCSGTA